jgi:hypothetical protein
MDPCELLVKQFFKKMFDTVLTRCESAAMLTKKRLKPAHGLRRAIEMYGGVNAAAKKWGIEYGSLSRFMQGRGGITDGTMLAILDGSGLSQDQAFTTQNK